MNAVRYGSLAVLLVTTGLLVWFVAAERNAGGGGLPAYEVASRQDVPGLGVVGEVLLPGATRGMPNREASLRAIAAAEGFSVAFYFSSEAAIDAHRATARSAAQTAALRAGLLGRLTRDEFTPGEALFP